MDNVTVLKFYFGESIIMIFILVYLIIPIGRGCDLIYNIYLSL